MEGIMLHTLPGGDKVVWHQNNQSISIRFHLARKVVSTSLLQGGYRRDITGLFNHNCGPEDGTHCKLRASTYREHLQVVAQGAGLDPERSTGMGTAARMENVAIVEKTYRELTVTAIVTAGVEGNGGRAGDPAEHYLPGEKIASHKPGTINIMLLIHGDMPEGALARALVTCTEAKTAALQELMAGSLYSTGLATGSGTDQTIVAADPDNPVYLEDTGKHSKLGELIGLAVKEGVKEALEKQSGLSPVMQHSVLRRCKRFGLTEEKLWRKYVAAHGMPVEKERFLEIIHQLDRNARAVTYTSLYLHLLDQYGWGLLSQREVLLAAKNILAAIAEYFGVAAKAPEGAEAELCIGKWGDWMVDWVKQETKKNHREESVSESGLDGIGMAEA